MAYHTQQQAIAPSKLWLIRTPEQSFKLLFELVAMTMPHANHAIAHLTGLDYWCIQASQCPSYASAPVWECICFCNATLMNNSDNSKRQLQCISVLVYSGGTACNATWLPCTWVLSQVVLNAAHFCTSTSQSCCHTTSVFMSCNISVHVTQYQHTCAVQ